MRVVVRAQSVVFQSCRGAQYSCTCKHVRLRLLASDHQCYFLRVLWKKKNSM